MKTHCNPTLQTLRAVTCSQCLELFKVSTVQNCWKNGLIESLEMLPLSLTVHSRENKQWCTLFIYPICVYKKWLLAQIYFWDSIKLTHCHSYLWHLVFWTQLAQICVCRGKVSQATDRTAFKVLTKWQGLIFVIAWISSYLLHLLNPNNLLNLILVLQPQSRICSVCCSRSGFEKTLFNCLLPKCIVSRQWQLWENQKCHRMFLQIYWRSVKCCHAVRYWGEK